MICPNIYTPEWNELVQRVGGELPAGQLFIENGHKIPYIIDGDPTSPVKGESVVVKDITNVKPLQVQSSNMDALITGGKTISFRSNTGVEEFKGVKEGDLMRIKVKNTLSDVYVKVTKKSNLQDFTQLSDSRKDDFAKALGFADYAEFKKKNLYANEFTAESRAFPDTYKFITGKVSGTIISYERVNIETETKVESDVSPELLLRYAKIKANLISTVNSKIAKYNQVVEKGALTEAESKRIIAYEQSLISTLKDFYDEEGKDALLSFIDRASIDINGLNKRITAEELTFDSLKQMREFSEAYGILSDIKDMINSEEGEELYGADTDKINETLDTTIGKLNRFKSRFKDKSIKFAAHEFALKSISGKARKKSELESLYQKNNPFKGSRSKQREEYLNARNEWVAFELTKSESEIFDSEKRRFESLLKTGLRDLDAAYKWVDPNSINDDIIQYLLAVTDERDVITKHTFIKDRVELLDEWEVYRKDKSSNIESLYEGLYEVRYDKDGKKIGNMPYYVRPAYHDWYEAKDQYNALTNNITLSEDEKQKAQMRLKKKYLKNPLSGWTDNNIADKYVNNQFSQLKGDKLELYNTLIKFNEESDALVPSNERLGYRLPGDRKSFWENAGDGNVLTAIKEWGKESFTFTEEDEGDYGKLDADMQVRTDDAGNPLKEIGIRYRHSPENQSYDLIGLALKNRYTSINYNEKSKVQSQLEIVQNIIETSKIVARSGTKKKIKGFQKRMYDMLGLDSNERKQVEEEGAKSKRFDAYSQLMDIRLYGRKRIKSKVDKYADRAQQFASNNFMIANVGSAIVNVTQGKVANWFASVDKRIYGKSNVLNAEAKYMKEVFNGSILKDVESLRPTSKTNMLNDLFVDESMDFSGFANDLSADSKFKRALGIGTLHGLSTSIEHYIQSTAMYSVLDNIKVKNSNNEYVDKEGKVVSDRKDAASMDEMYENVNGVLVFKEGFVPEGYSSIKDAEWRVNRKVKEVLKQLHGNYNPQNISLLQRHWYGRSAMFMRKWMIPGIQKRWRNVQFANKRLDEIPPEFRIFLESTGEETEGTYTSAFRFLIHNFNDYKKIKYSLLKESWYQLSDMERSNIRVAVREQIFMWLMLSSSILLKGLADEEDEEWLYAWAYLNRRLYSEFMFYTPLNPNEAFRTLATPSATMSSVQLLSDVIRQAFEDLYNLEFEEYQSGKRKRDTKLGTGLNKLFNPVYKNAIDLDFKHKLEGLDRK